MSASQMNESQKFIHISKYARWIESEGRRESSWGETADRYLGFMMKKFPNIPSKVWKLADKHLKSLGVVPSMRAAQMAGPALEGNNILGYNCAYIPFDCIKAVVDHFFILMCAAGSGFSTEGMYIGTKSCPDVVIDAGEEYVSQMPEVKRWYGNGNGVHVVADSAEGWALSLQAGLEAWFEGNDIEFDYSKVRPRGTRLKTKGGRASGPGPLKRLHEFCREIIHDAQGRKLNSLEWLDIGNVIGDVVVVGGVRRASEINFSDRDDNDIRYAKDFSKGQFPEYRYNSNNSAVYFEKPNSIEFMKEWAALAASGSGERGIFNLSAVKTLLPSRRKYTIHFRCNPCVSGDTIVNTSVGPRKVVDLIGKQFKATVDGVNYLSTDAGFWKTGTLPLLKVQTKEGVSIRVTANHRIKTTNGWVAAGDLESGDKLLLSQNSLANQWGKDSDSEFELGWLLGEIVGDGGFNPEKYPTYVRFWGETAGCMKQIATEFIHKNFDCRSDLGKTQTDIKTVASVKMDSFASKYIKPYTKEFKDSLETQTSSKFVCGFLRGFFDSDGTVNFNPIKGSNVRLTQINLSKLETVQRMLLRFGIKSSIYLNRHAKEKRLLPDSNREMVLYECEAVHELVISKDSIDLFNELVGFYEPSKKEKLQKIIGSRKRKVSKSNFIATVSDIKEDGIEDVYDCTIPGIESFDANGIIVHNCAEILLRPRQFCNLTEIVLRAEDDFDVLIEKVKVAVWLGCVQASLTDFPFIDPKFKENCEEERLLGVSITGQMDNPKLMTPEKLQILKKYAIKEAKKASTLLGINMPTAITTGKPSGTVSKLVESSDGAHPRYSKYYIRRYRLGAIDPLFRMMKDQGVKFEPENGQGPDAVEQKRQKLIAMGRSENEAKVLVPDWSEEQVQTWVFGIPVAAPENSITRSEMTAIQQLEWYLKMVENWCEHNQSITVYVRDDEWAEVGAWVYRNFDKLVAVSFLPYDGGKYKLPPYEEIDKDQYNSLLKEFPKLDYSQLGKYELEDTTTGAQQFACVGAGCDV